MGVEPQTDCALAIVGGDSMNGRIHQPSDELLRCPICHALYEPDYPSQREAPTGTEGYMQWKTGICSRSCELAAEAGGVL